MYVIHLCKYVCMCIIVHTYGMYGMHIYAWYVCMLCMVYLVYNELMYLCMYVC